ncbi:MBL fold metallo-hydrolase [Jonesia quinghaiensis]|uniref:MBL fold metallo-hydrolase n=1 Tax=Jonesia quinghaiensis TaxID=262806 RepID=UPI000411F26A|nr:MBL fold metallo-hydrolase [Jonesia quinghaiensis]
MRDARLLYAPCGRTHHNIAQLFRGAAPERRVFPAGVFLYRHHSGAVILYDTGYAPDTSSAGVRGKIYSRLLPPVVGPDDTVDKQLAALGVEPKDVTHVVLSHLHPDHIGGVRYFPQATFVMSSGLVESLQHSRLKDGVLRGLLPDWFADAQRIVLTPQELSVTSATGVTGWDVLGDGNYIVTSLPGHAQGHVGALVEGRVLLAGDASWGSDLVDSTEHMRRLPAAIQHDVAQYRATIVMLQRLRAEGIRVCFSHDEYSDKVLL